MQFRFRESTPAWTRIAWLVANAAIVESMAQAVSSFIDRDWPVTLWLCATGAIIVLAALAETIKRPVGE